MACLLIYLLTEHWVLLLWDSSFLFLSHHLDDPLMSLNIEKVTKDLIAKHPSLTFE